MEEILTWRKRKIDSWAKRRQTDIEQGKKKQQEDREAMRRFRTKWKLFPPHEQEQTKRIQRMTEPIEGNKQTKDKEMKQTELTLTTKVTNNETVEKHKATMTQDKHDKTVTEPNRKKHKTRMNNSETEKTEKVRGKGRNQRKAKSGGTDTEPSKTKPTNKTDNNGGKKRKEVESHDGRNRGETHSEPREETRKHEERKPVGKQKRRQQENKQEERPRKRKKQITIEQCMEKHGNRTREKLQRTPYDANNSDTMNDTGKQNTNRPKETNERPRIETERTGIG